MTPLRRRAMLLILSACLLGPPIILKAGALHSSVVEAISPEEAEEGKKERLELIFKSINFILLAAGLAVVLRKPLGDFFTHRSGSITKSLEEGRKALEASQAQLDAVEKKLRHLEEEIREFKVSVAREIHTERERLQKETAVAAAKILESARAQMETATRAARVELKAYAAQQSIELAEQMIRQRLDDSSRRRLISQFVEGLNGSRQSKVET